MSRRMLVVVCFVTALLAASAADAQWSTLQISKTFDGGKGEQQPAAVAYVNPPEGDHYWQVDVGVRLYEWLVENDTATLFFSPVAEYHRADAESTRRQTAVNKASVGFAVDSYFTQTPIRHAEGSCHGSLQAQSAAGPQRRRPVVPG